MTDLRYYATVEEVKEAAEEGQGICRWCGERRDGVEPDAERYKCEGCGEKQVYGAMEFVLNGWLE